MKWEKRNANVHDIETYVMETTGMSVNALNHPGTFDETVLDAAAEMIMKAVNEKKRITIVGDYDADGIDSICILSLIMQKIGADWSMIIPKRMSEGYGLGDSIMSRIPDGGLLITVDNGITAVDQIKDAKSRGMDVLILDHHNAGDELPPADLIMDPKAIADGWLFTEYCGAGISYKLAERMFPSDDDIDFIDTLSCFACIGTIADVMPLIGENRNIVNRGLQSINSQRCTEGLRELLTALEKEWYESDTVAFTVGPAINAPGRLEDDGGKDVVRCLLSKGAKAQILAASICEKNTIRKDYTAQAMASIEDGSAQVWGKGLNNEGITPSAVFMYSSEIKEGLCGLIAGKLAEAEHAPAFVTTDAGNGIIKGSARAGGNVNVYDLLKSCEEAGLLETFGGHDEAAGFSFKASNLSAVASKIVAESTGLPKETSNYYDFEIGLGDMVKTFGDICIIKPLGEGIPNPIIKISVPSVDFAYIGKDSGTLRISGLPVQMIGFASNGIAEKFKALGEPNKITVYGQLTSNWWKKKCNPQMQMIDIET